MTAQILLENASKCNALDETPSMIRRQNAAILIFLEELEKLLASRQPKPQPPQAADSAER